MNVFADLTRPIASRPGDPPQKKPAPVRRRVTPNGEAPPLPQIRNPWGLSILQVAVLQLMVEGKTNKEIAPALGISVKTVECHRCRVLEKMEVTNSLRAAILWDRFICGRSA